ncbi:MAG TPA: FtsX-like permease family protein [Candidatus Acidoferrales bacterium]|nr:FtsX-like permease family protein [Candidatus Acidoferrales bacterium]
MLVLLVTCANVGALLLVRGQAKRHEIVVRAAIGASAKRLFQQLFTESAILAGSAGVASLLVGLWCSHGLVRLMSTATASGSLNVPFDSPVLVFTAAVSLLACVSFGVIPVYQALRIELTSPLNQGAVVFASRHPRLGLGGVLIASQIGVSVCFWSSPAFLFKASATYPVSILDSTLITCSFSLGILAPHGEAQTMI